MLDLDPDNLPIEQKKLMGLWPSLDVIGVNLAPYIKRMNRDVKVVDAYSRLGENARYLADTVANIKRIHIDNSGFDLAVEEVIKSNCGNDPKIAIRPVFKDVDVICVNEFPNMTTGHLEDLYDRLVVGGIFAGNGHDKPYVKEALNNFRRNNRIGVPILVANFTWFWYKR